MFRPYMRVIFSTGQTTPRTIARQWTEWLSKPKDPGGPYYTTSRSKRPPEAHTDTSSPHKDCTRRKATHILTFIRLMTYVYIYIYIYICRTTPLTSRCCILYIYSTNMRAEYFKHAAHSPFFPLQNAVYFIMLPFLVPILFTF